jgi:hypothetical protein
MIDTQTGSRFTAVLAIGALVVGCVGADGEDSGETSISESALTSAALEGVLAGGEFRCAEAGKGDVIVKLERKGASRAEATLSGRVGSYEYPAGDPAVRLRLQNDALSGKRDINYGDIGRGYYCGGGGAAMNCGPERTDSVRIFDVGGEVRCTISVTKDEAYRNNVTQTVTGPLTPYVALPPPTVYGNPGSDRVVRYATGSLVGFQVSVPESTTLRHFGLVTTERGPNVIMALYQDVNGLPGSIIAATAPTPVSGADQHIAVEATPLPAGAYWVFAEFSDYVRLRATQSGATSYSWVAHTFETPLPTSIPSLRTPRGERPSLYFVAQ